MTERNDQPFDLDAVDVRQRAQEGVEMPLLDPARRDTGVILLVRGSDSQEYKGEQEAQLRGYVDRSGRAQTQDERNRNFWKLNATLLAGWKGRPLMRGGVPIEYTPANAASFLEQYDWAFEQVRKFADNRANFLPGPAKP